MKTRIHAIAGGIGFLAILVFWTATVASELFGLPETVAAVKNAIVWGLLVLIPSMAVVGGSGLSLGKGRTDAQTLAKKKRMAVIAFNGLIVLAPCALFAAERANSGMFDATFYAVQVLELNAGALNLVLMGMNMRDGLAASGRFRRK